MRASIVVLTYNQLEDGTRPCIESIYKFTDPNEFELIIVDNASIDGTPSYLRQVEKERGNVRLILNDQNKGYAGGNNDGIRLAIGDYVVLLNNDTMVTPNWLDLLLEPFSKDQSIGLVGPITNSAGNEQMVIIPNLNEENHVELAGQYIARNKGYFFDTDKLGFYCVAIRGDVVRKVGLLDEKFGIGMFEDDDYCVRVRKTGYRLIVNEGCFIYHKGSLSFKKLVEKKYQEIFTRNRAHFVSKHGEEWLFNNLTMAMFRQMQREVNNLRNKRQEPELERIAVRFSGFQYLIENAKTIERNKATNTNIMERGNNSSKRYSRYFNNILRGDNKSRRRLIRKAKRIYFPLKESDIIDRMGKIRMKEKFRKVLFIPNFNMLGLDWKDKSTISCFTQHGILVVAGLSSSDEDEIETINKVTNRFYLLNQQFAHYLQHLTTLDEMTVWVKGKEDVDILLRVRGRKVIIDTRNPFGTTWSEYYREQMPNPLWECFITDTNITMQSFDEHHSVTSNESHDLGGGVLRAISKMMVISK
jgi:GT2 family glycosyltransferase